MRDRGHEVASLGLESLLARDVPERIDHAVGAADGGQREPDVFASDLERERHRRRGRTDLRDRDAGGEQGPFGERGGQRPAEHTRGANSGHELRRAVPELDEAVRVEQEDPVADRFQHMGGELALGGDRPGSGLGRLEAPSLLLQARIPDRGAHLRDETLEELELVRGVPAGVAHQLHDSDHSALILDGHHHRRLRPRCARIRNLRDRAFAIDVVEHAFRTFGPLDDVVEEERLAADDDLALHASAFAVERDGRECRRVEHRALVPHVLAADEVVAVVVRRNEQTVVGEAVGEELVKALVDALRLEGLAELPGSVQQDLRDLGFPLELPVVHILSVASRTGSEKWPLG